MEEDLQWASAYEDYLNSLCRACGLERFGDDEFDVGTERCPGCEAIAIEQDRFQKDSTSPTDMSGLKFFIKPVLHNH